MFLGLSLLLFVVLLLVLLYLGYYLKRPDSPVFRYSLTIMVIVLGLLTAVILTVLGVMSLTLIKGSSFPMLNRVVEKVVIFIFPLILQLGKVLRIAQDKIQRSFIEVNNRLLEARNIKVLPQELLILLPHCLQEESCLHKITREPDNCRHCGNCSIDELLDLAGKWQVRIHVVTGGTLARKAVKMYKPRFIIAVACERDLSTGIIDSFPLPVWGVLNERPFGPCYNTYVSAAAVEDVLRKLVRRCENVPV